MPSTATWWAKPSPPCTENRGNRRRPWLSPKKHAAAQGRQNARGWRQGANPVLRKSSWRARGRQPPDASRPQKPPGKEKSAAQKQPYKSSQTKKSRLKSRLGKKQPRKSPLPNVRCLCLSLDRPNLPPSLVRQQRPDRLLSLAPGRFPWEIGRNPRHCRRSGGSRRMTAGVEFCREDSRPPTIQNPPGSGKDSEYIAPQQTRHFPLLQ